MFEYSKNPNVGPNAGWAPHKTLKYTRQILKEVFIGKDNIFGIVLKENNKLIGTVGLIEDEKDPGQLMLGYSIAEEYWGNGYATEAAIVVTRYGLDTLKLKEINAYCYPGNTKSWKVLEKCGFQYQGLLPKCEERYDGVICDNEYFRIRNK